MNEMRVVAVRPDHGQRDRPEEVVSAFRSAADGLPRAGVTGAGSH
jgi:hypothetical protein